MTAAMGLVILGCVFVILGVAVAFYGIYELARPQVAVWRQEEAGPPLNARLRGFLGLEEVIEDAVREALAEERFRQVVVEVRGGVVNLSGRVKTGTDKWDARNAVWLKAQPRVRAKIEAVFNNIVSDEPDPMPAAQSGTPEDSVWASRQLGFTAHDVLPLSPPITPYPLTDEERRRTGNPYWDNRPDAPSEKP